MSIQRYDYSGVLANTDFPPNEWVSYADHIAEIDRVREEEHVRARVIAARGEAMSEDYMCPLCVTPWKCNGPHIEPEDMANFNDYVNNWCDAMRDACIAAVEAWLDDGDDLADLLVVLREVQP